MRGASTSRTVGGGGKGDAGCRRKGEGALCCFCFGFSLWGTEGTGRGLLRAGTVGYCTHSRQDGGISFGVVGHPEVQQVLH